MYQATGRVLELSSSPTFTNVSNGDSQLDNSKRGSGNGFCLLVFLNGKFSFLSSYMCPEGMKWMAAIKFMRSVKFYRAVFNFYMSY